MLPVSVQERWLQARNDETFKRRVTQAEMLANPESKFKFPGAFANDVEKGVIAAVYWGYLIALAAVGNSESGRTGTGHIT